MILIAPNQPGFPDLTELLEAPPWPIPGRKHMLSQVDGSVWHSNLEPSCVIASGVSEEMGALQSRMLARSWEREHPLQDVCMLQNGECL